MIAYGSIHLKDTILMIYVSDRILKTAPILKYNMRQNNKLLSTQNWLNLPEFENPGALKDLWFLSKTYDFT